MQVALLPLAETDACNKPYAQGRPWSPERQSARPAVFCSRYTHRNSIDTTETPLRGRSLFRIGWDARPWNGRCLGFSFLYDVWPCEGLL